MEHYHLKVESRHMKSAKWHPKKKELTVTFHGKGGNPDKVYIYWDVPERYVKGLEDSVSKTRYLNTVIARNFDYEQLS